MEIQRGIGDQGGEALCLTNLGAVYLARGDTNNALTNFQQALQIRETLGVPGDIAAPLEGLGEVYTHTGQYDQALDLAHARAASSPAQATDAHQIAVVSHQMGLVFQYQGRLLDQRLATPSQHAADFLPSLALFQHVQEQQRLFQALLRGQGIRQALKRGQGLHVVTQAFQDLLCTRVEQRLREQRMMDMPDELFVVLASYIAGAFMTLMQWWPNRTWPGRPNGWMPFSVIWPCQGLTTC